MNIDVEPTNVGPLAGALIMLAVSVLLSIAAFLWFRYAESWQERTTRMMRRPGTSHFEGVMRRLTRNFGTGFLVISSFTIFVLAIREIIVS